eukprot:3439568-Amphidinium_carterae.1
MGYCIGIQPQSRHVKIQLASRWQPLRSGEAERSSEDGNGSRYQQERACFFSKSYALSGCSKGPESGRLWLTRFVTRNKACDSEVTA